MDHKEISWHAPEYYHFEKTVGWFWMSLFGTIVLVAIALLTRNILFAVFLIIAQALIVHWAKRTPPTLLFHANNHSLRLDKKKFYLYTHLSGFTIIHAFVHPEFDELILKTKSTLNRYVKILVPKEKHEEVKIFLSKFLPQIQYEDSLLEHIERIFGF